MNYLNIVGSAIGNKCLNWHVRESEVSESGCVLVAKFQQFNRAEKFARKWTVLTGSIKVRCNDGFNVSVPVDKPHFLR